MLCGECWTICQDHRRFACFGGQLGILLYAGGWEAFNQRETERNPSGIKDALEGRRDGAKIICWVAFPERSKLMWGTKKLD